MISITHSEVACVAKERKTGSAQWNPPPLKPERPHGWNGNGGGSEGNSQGPFRNSFIAVVLFLGADLMFFAGFIGAFLVLRFGADHWPPPDQPRLPLGVTSVNTMILVASGVTMFWAWRALSAGAYKTILSRLMLTLGLGVTFLAVQGYEWGRMLAYGLTLSQDVFGATFYTLIGCHAVHVIGAVVWMMLVIVRLRSNPERQVLTKYASVKLAGMYWFLVVALWPAIFGLVYLNP